MPAPLCAQEFRASIIGQVSDVSGAPIPGATVTAVERNTNQTYTTKSNIDGVFSVDFVQPGQYMVTVEVQGFSKKVYPNVTLQAAQKLNLNVTLSVGSVRQQVTVSAAPGLLNTANASSGGIVDQTKVENMPSEGHQSWMDLTFTEGVMLLSGANDFNLTPRNNSDMYSVNGSPATANSFFVNGAPVSITGAWDFSPSQDAIEEIQASASDGAQDGPAAGGVFNSVTKSGTNSFHGEVYEYYTNKALNSNSFEDNDTGVPKFPDFLNTFGANLGGPVQKGKTFFFFAYEGFRQDEPETLEESVPTAAMRNGDFAGTGYTIYDPSTVTCTKTTSTGCSTYGRSEFPGDTIPQSDTSAIGAKIMSLYPSPTLSGQLDNYALLSPRTFSYNQYIGRVDHDFSDSTRLYGMFTEQGNHEFTPGNAFPNAASTAEVPTGDDINAILDFTHTFSPSLVADTKASFGRYTTFTTTGTAVQQNYSVPGLTMPVVPTTTHQNIAPEVCVTSYTSLFGNTANGTVSNYWYLSPSLDQVKGRHTLHYGFEFMDIQTGASGIPSTPNGTFTFNPQWTQQNPLTAATGSGNSLASLLLGYPSSGSVTWGIKDFITYHYYAAYLQDDFKALKNVTLNLGLRWEVDTSPSERHNGINGPFCFTCTSPYNAQINAASYPGLENPLTGGLTFTGVTARRAPYNVPLTNWQPRVGFAWAITPKTVFRAGFGIYYSYGNLGTTNTGFSQTTSYVESLNGDVNPTNYFLSGTPFPTGVLVPAGAKGGLETDAGNAISYYSPSGAIPWTQHWTAGFQRTLPNQIRLDVDYAGSHSDNIYVDQPWDVISTAEQEACFANNAICNDAVSNPFYGVLPSAATLGSSETVDAWELMRTYPLFNGITQDNDPVGYSIYNALQVQFERQIKSLDFVANYAWAKNLYADAYLNNTDYVDSNLWYGPWSDEARQYVSANIVWPMAVGQGGLLFRNAHGILGGLLNHWQADSTFLYIGGYPLSISSADLKGGPGCTTYSPAAVGGQTLAHWFNNNENCYVQLLDWQPRTTPLYIDYVSNPGTFEWNAALRKNFALPREGMFLRFGIECYNCSNTAIFGPPNTTVADLPTFEPSVGETGFGTISGSSLSSTTRIVEVWLKLGF
jgi:hypothetical protein